MSLMPILELIEQYRGYMNGLGNTSLCEEEMVYISQRLDALLNIYQKLHKEHKTPQRSCA